MASPIYRNGTIEWTTVNADEQNVAHMPAYQWVILKKNVTDKNNISTLEIYNQILLSGISTISPTVTHTKPTGVKVKKERRS